MKVRPLPTTKLGCLALSMLLSSTLSSPLITLSALAQVQDVSKQDGIWTAPASTTPSASSSSSSSPSGASAPAGLPVIETPVFEPSKVSPLAAEQKAEAEKEEAKQKEHQKQQQELKAKIEAREKASTTGSASGSAEEPGMVAPVFKAGSHAALDQEKFNAEQKARASQPMHLYGRIEQLTATTGANFPITLKAMTPTLDTTPSKKLTAKVDANSSPALFSGTLAKSFPSDYRGNWGGTLTSWGVVQEPVCFKIDPVEATKLSKIFKRGSQGQVNFQFANNVKGGIYLAPAQVMFQESGADANLGAEMSKMMGGQMAGGMGAMMQQMAASMPVPVMFSFGDIQSSSMAKGLSGNDFVQHTLSNTTRQLAPNVLEQDVIAESNEIMRATGQPRRRYSESVLRFTKVNEQQMYVQAAAVTYGPRHDFQDKIMMYGYVTKGVVANTNPYSGMMGGMQGLQGIPGMQINPGQSGGAGQMPNIFGGGNGQTPQIPQGTLDALKGMFGQ